MAMKSYSFNNNQLRMYQIKHMKELRRSGVNPATASFPAGSRVRIRYVKQT